MKENYYSQIAEKIPTELILFSFGKRMLWRREKLIQNQSQL